MISVLCRSGREKTDVTVKGVPVFTGVTKSLSESVLETISVLWSQNWK